MPDAPQTPCLHPGCPEYAVRNGRCDDHVGEVDRRRGSAFKRGYDSAWERFRKYFIKRHPVCADCEIAPTTDVHHVKKLAAFPELRLVESNCLGLCHVCHSIRTARGE